MSSQLTRLADGLQLLTQRLQRDARTDGGALHEKFGASIDGLLQLRQIISARLLSNDARAEELQRVDLVLAELSATFARLPRAPQRDAVVSRPVRRYQQLRALRLSESMQRLLRRATLALGLASAGGALVALPMSAIAGCTGSGSTVTCTGSIADFIYYNEGSGYTTLNVNSLTTDINPPSTDVAIGLTNRGGDGTHHGAGGGGTIGDPGAAITVNITETVHTVSSTNASGIIGFSIGGEGGNGGDGALGVVSAGSGGGGGAGGNVTLTNSMAVTTHGDQSAGVWALSQGGQGGEGGDDYIGSGGGAGGQGGNAGTVNLTNHGAIVTSGYQSFGVFGQSVGGNGGQGGGSHGSFASAGTGGGADRGSTVTITNDGSITTSGDGAYGIYGESTGGFAGNGGSGQGLFGWGGSGSTGGDAGDVSVTNHATIMTSGQGAYGILAQSVGGGGGNGGSGVGIVGLGASGNIGGAGHTVSVTNTGTITTTGADSRGILAQSIGGGGGNGGVGAGLAGVGGSGSGTSPGGNVSVNNSGTITTSGVNGYAIEAQSVGGGGGDGGTAIGLIAIGSSGGAGGDAGTISVTNSGALTTSGAGAAAIYAQSVGGGGGAGSNADGQGGFVSLALGGKGGPGGNGSSVGVNSGTGAIVTHGDNSDGIQAQSLGGGGGSGGYAISASIGVYFSVTGAVGGSGGNGGTGAGVTVTNGSVITTHGAYSDGALAQSIGGGGGNAGVTIAATGSNGVSGAFTVGGKGGGGGGAGTASLTDTAAITTTGDTAMGFLVQSVGGGGGNGGLAITNVIGMNGALDVSVGGSGGSGGNGSDATGTSSGFVTTGGANSVAVLAQSLGGGGGNGGGTVTGAFAQNASLNVSVGGTGGSGGSAGHVTLTATGGAATTGDDANAVVAQSLGGGGGNGGFAVSAGFSQGFSGGASVGGNGTGGGAAGRVDLTAGGTITTGGATSLGVLAQSVGGGGGNGGFSATGELSEDANIEVVVGSKGGGGGDGSLVYATSSATVTTQGTQSIGFLAQSLGGGGGNGGMSFGGGFSQEANLAVTIGGTGAGGGNGAFVSATSTGLVTSHGAQADAILAQSVGGGGGNGGLAVGFGASEDATLNVTVGGGGSTGGNGGDVTLSSNGGATATGQFSDAVVAQSIGGGGGNGGLSITGSLSNGYSGAFSIGGFGAGGGNGGEVHLFSDGGTVQDLGRGTGILAQSIGGGGGNGGGAVSGNVTKDTAATFSIGGLAALGGNGGDVVLSSSSDVTTYLGTGVFAQSLGGGGGTGGFAVDAQGSQGETIAGLTIGVGGKGGAGGTGGSVDLTSTGTLTTNGDGVLAQSIGGGGGKGGFTGSFLFTLGDGKSLNFGIGGFGGAGGDAGAVSIHTSGSITTTNVGSYGVSGQSIGGGGGDGGWETTVTLSGGESTGTLVGAVGGQGAAGGRGNDVTINNTAAITTNSSHAYGLVGQSVGGGGGNGGFAASGTLSDGPDSAIITFAVGGNGGSGNDAGTVSITNYGSINTNGATANTVSGSNTNTSTGLVLDGSIGILAQSVGGGGGNGGSSYSGLIDGGPDSKQLMLNVGGAGKAGGKGGDVTVDNRAGGNVTTQGAFAYGIEAESIGGGGGNGGMALTAGMGFSAGDVSAIMGITVGGAGGDGNSAGAVTLTNAAQVTTHGEEASGIIAQSIGGGGGNGGAAITAIMNGGSSAVGSRAMNVAVAVGGGGGDGSNGGIVTVTNYNSLETHGDQSAGITAQSIGGGGGIGGNSNTISLVIGPGCSLPIPTAACVVAPGSQSNNWNLQASVGGNGGGASDGGAVTVTNSGTITTHGEDSDGIFAQSIGGGGGKGGNGTLGSGGLSPVPFEVPIGVIMGATPFYQDIGIAVGGNQGSSGNGAAVTVGNTVSITTSGANSSAIDAQSVGGGGGVGGDGVIGITGKIGIGGKGGSAGDGGDVTVTNSGTLTTGGTGAFGIFAQSVGGGGGRAGNIARGLSGFIGTKYAFGIGVGLDQGGGGGGNGGAVTVSNDGSITTTASTGIFVQTVGGGGGMLGDLGNGLAVNGPFGGYIGSAGDAGSGGTAQVTNHGIISVGGDGSAGIFVQSGGGQGTGGAITLTSTGNITTTGGHGYGIMMQTIGGGGAGVIGATVSGNITTSGATAGGILAYSLAAAQLIDNVVTATGDFTSTASSANVTVGYSNGTLHTTGTGADGIDAESAAWDQGTAGTVTVTVGGTIHADGLNSDGILATGATSLVTVQSGATVTGGSGTGAAVHILGLADNIFTNRGTISTASGLDGVTVLANGNTDFENYGTMDGSVSLGGGTSQFNNHAGATLNLGATIDLGNSTNTMQNVGTVSPGRTNNVYTTSLTGSYVQASTGNIALDLDYANTTADRFNVSGTASLNGTITPNFMHIEQLAPGHTDIVIVHADGGVTNAGVTFAAPSSAVVHYALQYNNADDVTLDVNINFAPPTGPGINANDTAIGNYINNIQLHGSSAALQPLIQHIFGLNDTQSLHDFYNTLSPAVYLGDQYHVQGAGAGLSSALMSCHPYSAGADFRFTEEDECTYARVTKNSDTIYDSAATLGSRTDEMNVLLGHQFKLGDMFRLGVAGSWSQSDTTVGALSHSTGQQLAGGAILKAVFDPYEFALAVTGGEALLRTQRFVAFPTPDVRAFSSQHDFFINERLRAAAQLWSDGSYYARPFAEVNVTQLNLGSFAEHGAGPLDVISPEHSETAAFAGIGFEVGGEYAMNDKTVLRPLFSYELRDTFLGAKQSISAGLEGAPAGIAPFTVTTDTGHLAHEFNAGVDIIGSDDMSVRLLYSGLYSDKTHEDSVSMKLVLPF